MEQAKKWHLIKSHIGRRALNNRDNTEKKRERERARGKEVESSV